MKSSENQSIYWILEKFRQLLTRISSHNPSIDDLDLRWVEQMIYDLENGVVLRRHDLKVANALWINWRDCTPPHPTAAPV